MLSIEDEPVPAVDAIRARLADLAEPGRPILSVVRKAAAITGVPVSDILSPSRQAAICWVRWAVMLAASERHSFAGIGRALGRDHTTVIAGVKRARGLRAKDVPFALLVEALSLLPQGEV